MSNIPYRSLELFLLCAFLSTGLADVARAQVGHPPESSPYRDMRSKFLVSLNGGLSAGSGGKIGAGPGDGPALGVRLDLQLAGPGSVQAGINRGSFNKIVIDPSAGDESGAADTVRQQVYMFDAGLVLTLTGQKTWYGFAPYFGASLGVALGTSLPGDTLSTFEFGAKFMVGPAIGLRWHPVSRVFLRIEGRDMIWKLSYPEEFFEGETPVLDPLVHKRSEWTHNPMLVVSVGIALK